MSLRSNQRYLDGLLNKVRRAVDVYTQSVVIETLTWLAVMTVQDSGNAAAQWQVALDGEFNHALDYREGSRVFGVSSVGRIGEKRRPRDEISSGDTLSALDETAIKTPEFAINVAGFNVRAIVMKEDYSYPKISIVNPIPPLGEDYANYEANAFFKVNVTEALQFGPERGLELAKKSSVVKNVTK